MLNALELVGFKSFPDRTRFDFPPGITVVVGPNGSGKSNIVDGIKWVLGEQSARSLRGKEMADVIFKGSSGPSGRKPSNTAEATIFLDNSERRLRMDCDEIRVTRRVYRSGEGEYMINSEPCRLKDIRNLFRGTGIGTDAYSLIEQGKVDQLLQASAKDRRAMFEEAAGISRFKAKKIETERRLARVEQNLVRLADIVDEVEGNYKRVKSQASKATRYKEYTDRLRALRTHVGAKDWRDFSRTLAEILEQKQSVEHLLEQKRLELKTLEEDSTSLDHTLSQNSGSVTELQSVLGTLLQNIAQRQSNLSLAQTRSDDLENQNLQMRESLAQLKLKLDDDNRNQEATLRELSDAENELTTVRGKLELSEVRQSEILETLEKVKLQLDSDRTEQTSIQVKASQLGQQISGLRSQITSTGGVKSKLLESIRQIETALVSRRETLAGTQESQELLQREAEQKDTNLRSAREKLEKLQHDFEAEKGRLNQLHRDQVGFNQRAEIIQELEKHQEGVDSGVKDLIKQAELDSTGIYGEVVGLVADLIKVNVQHASLIDLALGDRAQHVVVDGSQIIDSVARGSLRLNGRVGLIQLYPQRTATGTEREFQDQTGVVGRLDQLVQAKTEYHQVIRHLLGQTWLVRTLPVALELHEKTSNAATRFITLDGEVVETDGSVICGSRIGSTGIVSRRSELRDLHRRIEKLNSEIEESSAAVDQKQNNVRQQKTIIESLLGEHSEVSSRLAESRTKASLLENEIAQFASQASVFGVELQEVVSALTTAQTQFKAEQGSLDEQNERLEVLQTRLGKAEQQLNELNQSREEFQQQVTMQKVAFAKCEQQVVELRSRVASIDSRSIENKQALIGNRSQLANILWQRRAALRMIKTSETELVGLTAEQTKQNACLSALNEARQVADQSRRQVAKHLSETRDILRIKQDVLHEYQMREKDLSMQRSQLAVRLKDDYDIDIASLDDETNQIDENREQIDLEINELRAKVNNIGPVNMDALNELEDLEGRYLALSEQYRDLVDAKETLEKIIVRINNDSRKLFLETLEQIRINFQQLFRLTFGGGKADLILEEGVDVLEAGIDIQATPPGKPEFNNSLLSGGEKALTAVSLMMAIFKFRPSPFCILDEVDAPFDEANVGRFIGVLQSFLSWTKFVIVTHSKKTMTAATTLYGITMQESGVSKRVSVKFEDVNDQGQISEDAVRRDESRGDNSQIDSIQKIERRA